MGVNHKGTETQRKEQNGMEDYKAVPLDAALQALAYDVIGATIDVHRVLGPGWLEFSYEEALSVELRLRAIPFLRQHQVLLMYKSHKVGEGRVDLFIRDQLVVELKAVDALASIHTAQLLTYLRLTKCRLGLLVNFNVPILRNGIERVIL